MGLWIHCYAEVRQPDNSWKPIARNYDTKEVAPYGGEATFPLYMDKRFEVNVLLGFHDYAIPQLGRKPRGMPADVSDDLRLRRIESTVDAGATWFTLSELQEFDWTQDSCEGYGPFTEVAADLYKVMTSELPQRGKPDDIRIVCWLA